MTIDEALAILDAVFQDKALNSSKEQVFRCIWEGRTYEEMADILSYEISYIKHVGSELLQSLSTALGQKVTKSNCHSVLRRIAHFTRIQELPSTPVVTINKDPLSINSNSNFTGCEVKATANLVDFNREFTNHKQDWGNAVQDASIFYGRQQELNLLEQWIIKNNCRLVVLSGMGGVGKTTLSIKLAQQIQPEFDYLIWRSVRHGPLLKDLLQDIIKVFSNNEQEKSLPTEVNALVSEVITYLKKYRCLLILDSIESLFKIGSESGNYREGYEEYQEFFRLVGETYHHSCLMLTTRENLVEVVYMEAKTSSVRSLQVSGLKRSEGQQIIEAQELIGEEKEKRQLIDKYWGNPLALKIVSTLIKDLFCGDIADFSKLDTLVLDGISNLLEQQIERLTDLEIQIMYSLAIIRQQVKLSILLEDFSPNIPPSRLLSTLESLKRRSLIEKSAAGFTQQPMVREYMSEQLIEQFSEEMTTDSSNLLLHHALIKVQAKDYIRDRQTQVILEPLVNRLSNASCGLSNSGCLVTDNSGDVSRQPAPRLRA